MPGPPHQALNGIELRLYRDGDEGALVKLFEAAFGKWPKADLTVDSREHAAWKLRSSPEAVRHHVLAEDAGRVVAARCFWFVPVKLRNRLLRARQEVDDAVHPEYQDRGLMRTMTYPTRPGLLEAAAIYFALGTWHPAWRKMRRHETRRRRTVALDVLSTGGPPTALSTRHNFHEAEHFDGRFDELFNRAAEPFDFAVARTSGYLTWRFGDNRAGDFRIATMEEKGELTGYCIIRVSNCRGYIADLLALPGKEDVLDTLVAEAMSFFAAADVDSVECWSTSGHPYRSSLRRAGLRNRRRRMEVFFVPQSAADEDVDHLETPDAVVHVMAGDSDLV
jgi:hypothetical protein